MSGAANGPVIGFGELLVRLSPPGRQRIEQAIVLEMETGGAEANVLAGLAALGHDTAMVSVLPDNVLGKRTRSALAARGIDTRFIGTGSGRMGLYFFEPGAALRASAIVYDRADSAFVQASMQDFALEQALQGARMLHISGITPALGPQAAAAVLEAARMAKQAGVAICFDGNYRAQLWNSWDSDPVAILRELVGLADVMFGNHRDISLLLGREFSGDGQERRRVAALELFSEFPNLKLLSSTARYVTSADCCTLAARIDTPEERFQTRTVTITPIIDRIGTGDAFAAGILHGWLSGASLEDMAETGLAMGVLKHSIPGDMPIITHEDIAAFRGGNMDVRR